MEERNKPKSNYVIFALVLGIILSFRGEVFAKKEVSVSSLDAEAVMCTISEEYKKWDALSEEEKRNTIMPPMCDRNADTSEISLRGLQSEVSSIFKFETKGTLPTKYDAREQSYNVSVKDQQSTGQCWAFSTTSALEMFMKKTYNKECLFSPRHIEYTSTRAFLNGKVNEWGYNRTLGSGGNYYMSSSYLINGRGPVLESEMPFENNEDTIDISEIQNKTMTLDVNDIVMEYSSSGIACTTTAKNKIKQLIYDKGSVAITTYMNFNTNYYNSSTHAAYYNGSNGINHAVLLVGWDDNYSRTNFSSTNRPKSDGAWIVQNSYGTTEFGIDGYYYISYEDVHVCDIYMAIDSVDEEIEDNYYIHDKLGYISYIGYVSSTTNSGYTYAYAMNVFDKSSGSEILKEVSFGTNGTGAYEIYLYKGDASSLTIDDMTLVGEGSIDYSGYITHEFEKPILLNGNVDEFSIAIYYTMDYSTKPVPLSVATASKYAYISVSGGNSYLSSNGSEWMDLGTSSYKAIASIKAYTDNVDYSMTVDDVKIDEDSTEYNIDMKTTYKYMDYNEVTVELFDSSDKKINYDNVQFSENNIVINISKDRKLSYDNYYANIYYDNTLVGKVELLFGQRVTSDVYLVDQDNLLIYVQPNTSQKDFINNVNGLEDGAIESTSTLLATGKVIDNYIIIVLGDVNGDGLAKMNDVMTISKYIVEGEGIDESYYLLAADVTKDESIKMNDVMTISKFIVEGGTL